MGKYLASITDNSVSTCDETIDDKRLKTLATRAKLNDEATNPVSKNFNENKKKKCKTQDFSILLAFLLITIHYLQLLVFTVIWKNVEQNKDITTSRHK